MSVPAVARDEAAVLDIDRLDVYRVTVQFTAIVSRLRITPAGLRDQIDRASASIVLTLAEGVGRISPNRPCSLLRDGARQCAGVRAVLDLLQARGSLSESAHREARALLVRVVQMLGRLIDRQRSARAPRPTPVS
ncbi:MAG TPA: four helix bundle protein [Vicinamibacteria bacterium]|nr:four helix bundle protein [Vicinamibacteria bacterium]